MGLGFKVQASRLRVETVRLGLMVKLSQAPQAGGGGGSVGGARGVGGGVEGGGGRRGGGPVSWRSVCFQIVVAHGGGVPFPGKKGSDVWLWASGED